VTIPRLPPLDVPEPLHEGTWSVLAQQGDGARWELVDTERLPRQAFERVLAVGDFDTSSDPLAQLVSLRNALTRDGELLLWLGAGGGEDLRDLAARAGFTRVRELSTGSRFWTLELRR
jgi:hypothetical protein